MALMWTNRCGGHRCAGRCFSCESATRLARSHLHHGWICRRYRSLSLVCPTAVDRRFFAGLIGPSRAVRSSLDRWPASRGCCRSRQRPLDHQPTGRDRRPSFQITNIVFPLGRDRHVDCLCRRSFGFTPPAAPLATTNVAHLSFVARCCYRHRERSSLYTNRGDDGDIVESSAVRSGPRGNRQSHV